MKKYVHIGFPKNFSTSLQRSFFPQHSQLYHLGVGSSGDNLGYINTTIETALELYLNSCKKFKYLENRDRIKEEFENLADTASRLNGIKRIGISCEHLSFAFSMDGLGSHEKAERLFDIFGSNTKIIMIIRNQKDLIRSLFKESIRQGLLHNYDQYLEFIYKFQDRNFYYDFCYDAVYRIYSELFGKDNVGVFCFENYFSKSNQTLNSFRLVENLCDFLEIDREDLPIDHHNQSMNEYELQGLLEINHKNHHDLGNNLYNSAENHRIKSYLLEELGLGYSEAEIFKDTRIKRKNAALAISNPSDQSLDWSCNKEIEKKIFFKYSDSNKKLKELKINLPQEYQF